MTTGLQIFPSLLNKKSVSDRKYLVNGDGLNDQVDKKTTTQVQSVVMRGCCCTVNHRCTCGLVNTTSPL